MRIWDYRLLPYLSELQFKGQLRELVAIMHDWKNKGTTNHLLINKVMQYDKKHLTSYFLIYNQEYIKRYNKDIDRNLFWEFLDFANYEYGKDFKLDISSLDIISIRLVKDIFPDWHTKEYLRSNMANLWEKHFMGVGKSRISDEEWETLLRGYKEITGEEYVI